ncbi:alpha/beta hydrolase [Saccharopolyspora hirsuta]|uniref:Alpha/beta hydrolase n=1 Tax=Saccharopolyspora hirsuta TaxID=1837 RepID=A0A5M7BWS2_SACHI|nr:alpha/beta hydrolase [Saccharopolyspora hirsuta]KAA5832657.1 alpha/beta hydrolase [Saccharopolyspora hirsuta]
MARQVFRDFDVSAGDGARFREWAEAGAAARPMVLRCPELDGAPELLPVDSATRTLTWSPRRADAATPGEHAADAIAALDAVGAETGVVVGWSGGTVVAVELAQRFPDRVRGLLLLAGPPTLGTDALLRAFGVPDTARRLLALGGSASLRLVGDLLESITANLPIADLPTRLLQNSGLLRADADGAALAAAVRRLLQHDWRWHAELSLAWSASVRSRVSGLSCPVTVLAGAHDVLADVGSVAKSVAELPQARVRTLPTSHFLPFEAPDAVRAELAQLLRRVQAVECARLGIDPPPPEVPRPVPPLPVPPLRDSQRW